MLTGFRVKCERHCTSSRCYGKHRVYGNERCSGKTTNHHKTPSRSGLPWTKRYLSFIYITKVD